MLFTSFYQKRTRISFPIVTNYKLSSTGFNKFLNIVDEGPQSFLEENILKFPQKKVFSLSYGTAIHGAISEIYLQLQQTGKLISFSKLIDVFIIFLKKERLSEVDFNKGLSKGKVALYTFYKQRKPSLDITYEVEKNFQHQNCFVDDVSITGKIDKISYTKNKIEVTDFKTGKSFRSWESPGNELEKIKAWKYRNQLIFYKILIESSDQHKDKSTVDKGVLEFIEPQKKEKIKLLSLDMKNEDIQRTKNLIVAVGKKIKNLDFPSLQKCGGKTLKDIIAFEDCILNKNDHEL